MRLGRITAAVLAAVAMGGARADLTEGFDNVAGLAASGWVLTNISAPVGESWFQGNSGIFDSQAGAAGAYVGANFLSASNGTGVVDNWLITPTLSLTGGGTLSFYTRTDGPGFSDGLQVLFSTGGSSTASFTSLLLTVGSGSNPYNTSGWTQYTVALPDAASGRIAFRYTVADALNANYIGIDTVSVTAVPEPATMALFGLGLAAITVARRRKTAA